MGRQHAPTNARTVTGNGLSRAFLDGRAVRFLRSRALRDPLTRLCAVNLTTTPDSRGPADSVARFHLGNGARLERVNWLGNVAARGISESYGIMVNYLYDPEQIEANHEAFVRGAIVRSAAVDALLGSPAPAATVRSQSQRRTRRPRKR